MSHKICSRCDSYAIEKIEHLIMQCPSFEQQRASMLKDIGDISVFFDKVLSDNPSKVVYWLLGDTIKDLGFEDMLGLWLIAGKTVDSIYRQTIAGRDGIG